MPEERARRYLEKLRRHLHLDRMHPLPWKIVVTLIGGLILIIGVVMIVTPGPAFVLIPVGLLALGSEFTWAEKALRKTMEALRNLRLKWKITRKVAAFPRPCISTMDAPAGFTGSDAGFSIPTPNALTNGSSTTPPPLSPGN